MRSETLERPPLRRHFPFGVEDRERAFVSLRLGVAAPLIFFHDLARIVGCLRRGSQRHQYNDR